MTTRNALRALALASLLISATAHATIFRAYLASDGNDANPCTLPQPCRLLPAALTAVTDGGEIWMLDSANYNTATVTVGKSVSILAVPGAVGSVLAIGGPAISITSGSLGIALRNVVIAPLAGAGGTHGVSMTGGSTLTIEHSLIANLPNRGVSVVGAGTVRIANSIIRNSGDFAVWLESGASGLVSGTQMLGNAGGGVTAYGAAGDATTTRALVSDSVISGGAAGVKADAGSGASLHIGVTGCTIEGTDKALWSVAADVAATEIIVSHSVIMNNNYRYYQSGAFAFIETAGNNQMGMNNQSFGLTTPAALQ